MKTRIYIVVTTTIYIVTTKEIRLEVVEVDFYEECI